MAVAQRDEDKERYGGQQRKRVLYGDIKRWISADFDQIHLGVSGEYNTGGYLRRDV
jgi:hypothetical protein